MQLFFWPLQINVNCALKNEINAIMENIVWVCISDILDSISKISNLRLRVNDFKLEVVQLEVKMVQIREYDNVYVMAFLCLVRSKFESNNKGRPEMNNERKQRSAISSFNFKCLVRIESRQRLYKVLHLLLFLGFRKMWINKITPRLKEENGSGNRIGVQSTFVICRNISRNGTATSANDFAKTGVVGAMTGQA